MSKLVPDSAPPSSSPGAPEPSQGSSVLHNFGRAMFWVPTLYLAMGIPFNVINGTAGTMYKSLGFADSQITGALGSIVLMWSLKPFWSAFLDMYRTKKFFVISMEVVLALFFAAVAMMLPMPDFFRYSILVLWLAAFASSTQDICGDGIYLTGLNSKTQANLAGVQGLFWNLGKILATGVLVASMESVAKSNGWSTQTMWQSIWWVVAGSMALFAIYHVFFLPTGSIAHRPHSAKQVVDDFWATAVTFFHKRAFWGMLAFVLLYRCGEGLLLVEGKLFLQGSIEQGGLGLSAGEASSIDATWGTAASILGGILGGMFLGKLGLKKSLPILGLCLNIPHFTFVYLSQKAGANHGLDYSTIAILVAIEKFGYGFGFIGNMVYMMQQLAPGRWTMSHYAFATAIMNLVLSPTIMISGPLAETVGFSTFFIIVMFASVPSVWAAWRAPFPLSGNEPAENKSGSGQVVVTSDDPSRLSETERKIQSIAGRASAFAVLNILVLLVADATLLDWLYAQSRGNELSPIGGALASFGSSVAGKSALFFFILLAAMAVLKLWLSFKTVAIGRDAFALAGASGETAYRGNARGAIVATVVCALISVVVLYFGAKLGL